MFFFWYELCVIYCLKRDNHKQRLFLANILTEWSEFYQYKVFNMVAITGILQFLLIVNVLFFEYNRKSPAIFMWVTLFVIFSIPHLLYSIGVAPVSYGSDVLIAAALNVIIFTLLYSITRRLSNSKNQFIVFQNLDRNIKLERLFFLVLIVLALSGMYVAYVSSGSIFESSWSSRREYAGDNDSFIVRFLGLLKYPAASLILIYLLHNEKRLKVFIPILLVLLYAILTRRRIDILVVLVCFISYFIFKGKRLTPQLLFKLAIIGCISIYLIYALQIFRYGGSINSFLELYSGRWGTFNERVLEKMFDGEGELGLQQAFYYFIDNNNNYPGFGEGHTYIRMLMVLLPTSVTAGIKPPDFAITMGSFWNPNAGQGFSMHPTLFGDVFANFNFIGVIMGVFWGAFCNSIDKILNMNRNYLYLPLFVLFSCCLVIIGRGSVYNGFFALVISYLIIKAIDFLYLKSK